MAVKKFDISNAGQEYRPVVMWFWQDKITKDEITKQLEGFKEQGIYEYFIHGMFGLQTEYMSDEFMELVKFSVAEAKRLGMHFWIYDENNWPSGTVGGKLLEKYPWTKGKCLRRSQQLVGSFSLHEQVANGVFLKAFLEDNDSGTLEYVDITSQIKAESNGITTKVSYLNDCMNNVVIDLYFVEYQDTPLASAHWSKGLTETRGYIDTFNPKAVRKYIEMTHERYKKYIGKEFGTVVRGVFTDETTMCAVGDIIKNNCVVFNDCTLSEFKKRYGYDLADHLNYLFVPCVTEQQMKVRNDFWNLVTDLYVTNFIGQMSDWCHDNKLMFTGHFGGEEHAIWSLLETGDMQLALTKLDRPGMDSILSSQFINNTNFNNAGKLVSSVAKFTGKDRVLTETYTASGWDIHFDLMKKIANRIVTMGGNFIQYMGAYYSLNGSRNYLPITYSPSHNYNNPLYCYYDKFGSYVAAMQYLSAITKPDGKIMVIAPNTHMKQSFTPSVMDLTKFPNSHVPDSEETEKLYEYTIRALLDAHIEFDIVSEAFLEKFENNGGKTSLYGYDYDAVILPRIKYYDKKIAAFLSASDATDLKKIFIGVIPTESVDGSVIGFKPDEFVKVKGNVSAVESKKLTAYTSNKAIEVEDLRKFFAAFFKDQITLNIKADGTVYTSKRKNDDGYVFFIDNDENRQVKVSFDALPGMKLYSPETREERPCTVKNGKVSVTMNEYELIMAVVDNSCNDTIKTSEKVIDKYFAVDGKAKSEIVLNNFAFKPENNAFICSFEYSFRDLPYQQAALNTIFNERQIIRMGDKYKARAKFNIKNYSGRIELFADLEGIEKLMLNGKELKLSNNCRLWGPDNFKTDISALVHDGENLVEMEAAVPNYRSFHKIPNVVIFGDFALIDGALTSYDCNKIKYGDYSELGFRYCTGKASYEFTFTVEKAKKAYLFVDTDDAFDVYLNGKKVDSVMWKPNIAELEGFVSGENKLTVVTDSPYANFMDCRTRNGILSPVTIKFFE